MEKKNDLEFVYRVFYYTESEDKERRITTKYPNGSAMYIVLRRVEDHQRTVSFVNKFIIPVYMYFNPIGKGYSRLD